MATLDTAAAAAVLAELDGEWSVENRHGHYIAATRADGLALGFHAEWNAPAGKVQASYAPPSHDLVRYNEHAPRVNVTLTRDPATVARDLARRLMPAAEAFHALMLERVAARDTYADSVTSNAAILSAAYGGPLEGDHARLSYPSGFGDVQVYADSVTLELHGLPVTTAAAILALVRA